MNVQRFDGIRGRESVPGMYVLACDYDAVAAELDREKNANTWSRLKDRIFQLEAALRTIAAYRGKNAVAHQLAYIAEAALDSETPPQPDGDYTDSIDIEPSCGTSETKGHDLNLQPIGKCDRCGRKVWKSTTLGQVDEMLQPGGGICGGRFVSLERERN